MLDSIIPKVTWKVGFVNEKRRKSRVAEAEAYISDNKREVTDNNAMDLVRKKLVRAWIIKGSGSNRYRSNTRTNCHQRPYPA